MTGVTRGPDGIKRYDGLRALGVQHGDRVAIQLGNGVDWASAAQR